MSDVTDLIEKLGFNTNGVYKFYGARGDSRSAQIGLYNGAVSFTVWDSQNRGGPIQSVSWSRDAVVLIVRVLRQLLKAQPDTTLTIEQQKYVKEGERGSYVKDTLFKFVKNDKQMYLMEVTSPKLSTPLLLTFKGAGGLNIGAGELTDSDKSGVAVESFISFLVEELPILRCLSLFNMKKKTFNKGGSGGQAPSTSQNSYSSGGDEY